MGITLDEVAVVGSSDGNFAAVMGVPVLEGLGAIWDGAHARGEHIFVDGMVERAILLAGLLHALAVR
jgi:glutamate carboxypeptidase